MAPLAGRAAAGDGARVGAGAVRRRAASGVRGGPGARRGAQSGRPAAQRQTAPRAPGVAAARGGRYDARVILAGDIGGTKTLLALYEPGSPVRSPVRARRLASREFGSLAELVRGFLAEGAGRPARAVFGIAGPVVEQRVEATNLPWTISAAELGGALGAEVLLVNDLEAQGWGLSQLGPAELEALQPGRPARGNRALIAAGTGLGEAILVPEGNGWRPMASEGGHADFGPRDELEDELLRWLRARYGRASYERVLSGPGLADLHRFLRDTGRGEEPEAFARAFDAAGDPGALVGEAAVAGSCGRARLAVERFVSIYGAEAGNLALKALAVNGVFVGGGIAPRVLSFMRAPSFLAAFGGKGRLSPVLAHVPVSIVLEQRAALWGAAALAQAWGPAA